MSVSGSAVGSRSVEVADEAPAPTAEVEAVSATTSAEPGRRGRAWVDRRTLVLFVGRILLVAVVLGLWELTANRRWVNPAFIGQPTEVWDRLVEFYRSGDLWSQTYATMKATLLAFAISVPLGTGLGLLLGTVRWLDDLVSPFLVPLNTFPRVALVPVFIVWFGLSTEAKVALAVSLVVFILLFNARAAIRSVDPDHVMVARVIGLSRVQMATKVVLPSAVPSLFAGLRLALTYSLLGVVASEMVASRDGLGQEIVFYGNQLEVSGIIAVIVVLVIVATVIAVLFDAAERRLLRWQ